MTTGFADPIVIREGSSLRTQNELDLLFIQDVFDLSRLDPDWVVRDKADDLLGCASAAFDETGIWTNEDLENLANEAEDLLYTIGFEVEWSDGYAIHPRA